MTDYIYTQKYSWVYISINTALTENVVGQALQHLNARIVLQIGHGRYLPHHFVNYSLTISPFVAILYSLSY
jgi:hypothetical protein